MTGNPIASLPETCQGVTMTVPNSPCLIAASERFADHLRFSQEYPNEIIEGLYLGERRHLDNDVLHKIGVTVVFNCALEESDRANLLQAKVCNLRLEDSDEAQIDFYEIAGLIHKALNSRKRVLVNCAQGKSRSASVVIAYLMLYQGKCLQEAVDFVRDRRPKIDPNENFMSQLRSLEGILNSGDTQEPEPAPTAGNPLQPEEGLLDSEGSSSDSDS